MFLLTVSSQLPILWSVTGEKDNSKVTKKG